MKSILTELYAYYHISKEMMDHVIIKKICSQKYKDK